MTGRRMQNKSAIQLEQIRKMLKCFPEKHILVVGDLILDQYVWGNVDRISPEAPVPVVNVVRTEYRPGGAGNVAANLASLGCRVTLTGLCGDDQSGQTLQATLSRLGVAHSFIKSSRPTTVKTRVIAHHQQVVRIDQEENTTVDKNLRGKLLSAVTDSVRQFDGMIISDYAKGLLTEDLVAELIRIAQPRPVIIDPKGYHYNKYRGATALKPNFKEFCAAIRRPDLPKAQVAQYAPKLVAELNLAGLIVTLGEDGVFILDDQGTGHRLETQAREVFDVSGAGDTFIATFCAALLVSGNWRQSGEFANLTSGLAVGKIGTATVTVQEILASFS